MTRDIQWDKPTTAEEPHFGVYKKAWEAVYLYVIIIDYLWELKL